jgi:hypothetical protein
MRQRVLLFGTHAWARSQAGAAPRRVRAANAARLEGLMPPRA